MYHLPHAYGCQQLQNGSKFLRHGIYATGFILKYILHAWAIGKVLSITCLL